MKYRYLLAIPALLAALGAQAQERTADPLAPLAQCINRSEFKFKGQDRLPAGATTRSVKLAMGEGEHFDTAAFKALIRAAVTANTAQKPKRTNT